MRTSPKHGGMFELSKGKPCDLAILRLEVHLRTKAFQYSI